MLNEALLLDSARPVSNPNMTIGCPERSSEGVLSSYLEEDYCWYVLRVSYSRELKIKEILDQRGLRTFVPMIWRPSSPTRSGNSRQLVPAVNNLCFVYWSKSGIDRFIQEYGDKSPVHYYWDRTASRPMTVPDKAMDDFIKVASSMDEGLIYLTEISGKLREGQPVEVIDGPLKGIKGKIVRIKKNRRVLVELSGFLAVTTNYLSPQSLKIG